MYYFPFDACMRVFLSCILQILSFIFLILYTIVAQAEAQQEQDTLRLMENSLSTVTREQKEVFIVAYQKFVQVLQEKLTSSSTGSEDVETTWTYKWIFGWYREMMRLVSIN